ncbi:probable Mitochondrial oxaloacetate transport protein [Hanseniaspora guilliermondii]|uniref:Mitochondrial oxaloacetate transport protein n=1 Tax=Hanseniaspora guilliermondii TaxID=56406 RepID=A0A1L0FN35_9ASCO|nr:probable Mitochondrial oxaloacetate transport protein [Hanseniaspora guilliermondii]
MSSEKIEHKKSAAQKVSTAGSFIAGAAAACIAVTVTNPIEVVKTRMQLQGELSGKTGQKIYTNPFQALKVIFQNEGIRGLQKGLSCAYIYQMGLNGCRLGFYEPVRYQLNSLIVSNGQDPHKLQNPIINVFSGAISGIAGAIVGSPLYLVKTRMQSYSSHIQIGQQTHYKSFIDGLTQIYKKEGGIMGLFKGVDAAILRTGAGSAVQLPIYNTAKSFLVNGGLMKEGTALHLTASLISGIGVGIVMNPWDVILTRVYNQQGHSYYTGPIDCMKKTIKSEGVMALYKGFGAQLFRIAPHTILCLTFMEQTMKIVVAVESKLTA